MSPVSELSWRSSSRPWSRCRAGAAAGGDRPAYENADLSVRARVADLLSRMTLEEKVGQMTQAERGPVYDDATPITTWRVGQRPVRRRLRAHPNTPGRGPTWWTASSGRRSPRACTSR